MNRKKIGIAIAALGLFAGYLYATPYITLFMLKRAIEAKSAKEVEKFIDFADVRDSLRSQLADYLQEQVAKDPDTAGFEGLAAGIGSAFGGSMIDTLVRPANLQKWLDGEQPVNKPEKRTQSFPRLTDALASPALGYVDFDIFEVKLSNSEIVDSLIFERRNIFAWKLVGAKLGDLLSLDSKLEESPNGTTAEQSVESDTGAVGDLKQSVEKIESHASRFSANARCHVKIKGETVINGKCHFDPSSGILSDLKLVTACPLDNCFGATSYIKTPGYFFYLSDDKSGATDVSSNSGLTDRAHDYLGSFQKVDNCWVNGSSRICVYRS